MPPKCLGLCPRPQFVSWSLCSNVRKPKRWQSTVCQANWLVKLPKGLSISVFCFNFLKHVFLNDKLGSYSLPNHQKQGWTIRFYGARMNQNTPNILLYQRTAITKCNTSKKITVAYYFGLLAWLKVVHSIAILWTRVFSYFLQLQQHFHNAYSVKL